MPEKLGNGGNGPEEYNPNNGQYVADGEQNKYHDNPKEDKPKLTSLPKNKEDCISLNNKKANRTGANKIVYDAAENGKIEMPENFEDSYSLFLQSCSVNHENQIGDNSFDDDIVQPYIQENVIKSIMKSHWDKGVKIQFIYNPYNVYDIRGCDYWLFIEGKDGNLKRLAVDVKTNLSALNPNNKGVEKGYKFVMHHYNFNDDQRSLGFFAKSKITNFYLFTTMYSNRAEGGQLQSVDEIDSTKNIFANTKAFMSELKNATNFNGNDEDFRRHLTQQSEMLINFAKRFKNGESLEDLGRDFDLKMFNFNKNKAPNMVKSFSLNLGEFSKFELKLDIYKDGKSQVYFNMDKMDEIGANLKKQSKAQTFKENNGINKFAKKQVEKYK